MSIAKSNIAQKTDAAKAQEHDDIEVVGADPAYRESIKELLLMAMDASPMGKIYIYVRHQSDLGASNMAGTLTVDRFMTDVIGKERLLSNFVYVLSKNAETDLTTLVNEAVNQNS